MVGVAQVNGIDPLYMSAYNYSKVFLCVKLYKLFKSGYLMPFSKAVLLFWSEIVYAKQI